VLRKSLQLVGRDKLIESAGTEACEVQRYEPETELPQFFHDGVADRWLA
jgi:hypothetical protein